MASWRIGRPARSDDHGLRLLHPIYLDVPMLVSFAAAVEGGISFRRTVTRREASRRRRDAVAGVRLGLRALLTSLDASAWVKGRYADSNHAEAISKEARSHTEASIAILLYDTLTRDGADSQLRPVHETDIGALTTGQLVELKGEVVKNAIDALIDYIDAVRILRGLTGDQHEATDLDRIRAALDEDRERTGIRNVLLTPSPALGFQAVVTLRAENLRKITMTELHGSTVNVVGKITRVVPQGGWLSPFGNYGMSLVPPEPLARTLEAIRETMPELDLAFGEVSVPGLAYQVLPLMIFV